MCIRDSRYTEARLKEISEEMLQDLEKETVKMIPNFDNSLKEPELLPAKIPNLLINGSQGIAVGMMTNMPPHNLSEVIEAVIAYIKKPTITIEELMDYIKGPDFPTGAYMFSEGLSDIYKKGKGSIIIKAKASIEKIKERERIVITQLPYQVNKAELIKKIAELVKARRIEDITEIRDESAKDQIRVVIILKKGANSKLILNKLFKLTPLQTKFNAIMLALVENQPKILNLKQLIECFVNHRISIIKKRTKYDLEKAKEHAHLLEGLILTLKNLNKIIELIRKSKNGKEASSLLISNFGLTQKQAQAVLEMKLQRLTKLEQEKIAKDYETTKKKIKEYEALLASEKAILKVIINELQEIKRKFGDKRRTILLGKSPKEIKEIDLIKKEQVAVLLTAKGYIKRMPLKIYQEQRRGGKGITGTELTEEDFVQKVFICSTHDYVLFITERGLLYMLKAYQIPEATRYSKGKALINLLKIKNKVKGIICTAELKGSLLLVTKKGIAKRINLKTFSRIKKSGVRIAKLPNDDEIVDAKLCSEEDEVFIATKKGIATRFDVKEIREMGKAAYGVTAIKLGKEDSVIMAEVLKDKDETVLTITEKGYGKRTSLKEYRKTARACKGIVNIKCSERNGDVAAIQLVKEQDSIVVTTAKGMVIRIPIREIRVMSRNTQGVRIIKLKPGDKVTDAVRVIIES